jgi:hypothetical protein
MKKVLTVALLSLSLTGPAVPSASAGAFGLFPSCGCCGCGCSVCIRQYNAFSPVCCGTMFCDGCMPFGNCGAGGCGGPAGPWGLNYMGQAGCGACGAGGCGPGGCAANFGQLPPTGGMPVVPPGATVESMPQAMPTGPTSATTVAVGQPGAYPVSYHPAYYPGYGYGYAPQMPASGPGGNVPVYWNGR